MSVSLIVEDGSGVAGANSYCTGAYARQYALNGGIQFPGTADDALIAYATQAVLYLETMEPQFKGRPTYVGQELAWPRTNVYWRGMLLDHLSIPQRVVDAQVQLMIEVASGTVLLPTRSASNQGGGFVTMEKVDVLETHYSETVGVLSAPIIKSVEALLLPFLNRGIGLLTLERG